jgi:hypothetical protein
MGIIDLDRAPLEYMFGAAAILLFLCSELNIHQNRIR